MKSLGLFCLRLAPLAALMLLSACDTTTPKKPKPIPPHEDIDEKPWNRPRSWENNSKFGGMMPQSH